MKWVTTVQSNFSLKGILRSGDATSGRMHMTGLIRCRNRIFQYIIGFDKSGQASIEVKRRSHNSVTREPHKTLNGIARRATM